MEMTDLKQMDKAQATEKLQTLRREAFDLKFSKHTGVSEKPNVLKDIKKNIARLLTHINAK